MNEKKNILETISCLGADTLSGVYLQSAATEAAIEGMQNSSVQCLGHAIPEEYVQFLRRTNGAQINGAYFKSAEHIVPENLDVAQPSVIVLGQDGNTADFVFDKRDSCFHIINVGHADERFASFGSLEELLVEVLREQGIGR